MTNSPFPNPPKDRNNRDLVHRWMKDNQGSPNLAHPGGDLEHNGFTPFNSLSSKTLNYVFHSFSMWLNYLKTYCDKLAERTYLDDYDFICRNEGELEKALAEQKDGYSILVKSNQKLTKPIHIHKSYVSIKCMWGTTIYAEKGQELDIAFDVEGDFFSMEQCKFQNIAYPIQFKSSFKMCYFTKNVIVSIANRHTFYKGEHPENFIADGSRWFKL